MEYHDPDSSGPMSQYDVTGLQPFHILDIGPHLHYDGGLTYCAYNMQFDHVTPLLPMTDLMEDHLLVHNLQVTYLGLPCGVLPP